MSIALPDWLTEKGKEVWLDSIDHCVPPLIEADVYCFASYCNIQGIIMQCYIDDERPPINYLLEARKLAKMFGLCGAKSRATEADTRSPFMRRGKFK